MTLADLLIVLLLLAMVGLIVLGFVWSVPDRAAQPRPVAAQHVPPLSPSVTNERLAALALAELARLGEVRRVAEARLREVGR